MTDSGDRKAKGGFMLGYQKYIRKKWGQRGIDAVKEATGFDLNEVQSEKWYPESIYVSILDHMEKTHGVESIEMMGYHGVISRGVVSYVAFMAGIDRILEKGANEFRSNFNFGDVSIEKATNMATITFTDAMSNENVALSWRGALKGILELAKKKGTIDLTADPDGKRHVYVMKWE